MINKNFSPSLESLLSGVICALHQPCDLTLQASAEGLHQHILTLARQGRLNPEQGNRAAAALLQAQKRLVKP